MYFTVLPPQNQELPLIRGNKPKVMEGELLNVECVSSPTFPAANLTWSINNRPVSDILEFVLYII